MLAFIANCCILLLAALAFSEACKDTDRTGSCSDWAKFGLCEERSYVIRRCQSSCGVCNPNITTPAKYLTDNLPNELTQLKRFVGHWRSTVHGKIHFPTIPVFTYAEELDFSVINNPRATGLNYSGIAWAPHSGLDLHSETGFLSVKNGSQTEVALTTIMNSAFITVEEGYITGNIIELNLQSIARVSWTRELTVTNTKRIFRLLDDETLEQRFFMETVTHSMQEHSSIYYEKIQV